MYLIAHFLGEKKIKKKKILTTLIGSLRRKLKAMTKKALLTINAVQEESSGTLMLVGSDNPYLSRLICHEERNVSLYKP